MLEKAGCQIENKFCLAVLCYDKPLQGIETFIVKSVEADWLPSNRNKFTETIVKQQINDWWDKIHGATA